MPSFALIERTITKAENRAWSSAALQAHEKHGSGYYLVSYTKATEYAEVESLTRKAEDTRRLVYLSQISQAYGVGLGIMAQRLARSHSWGTLYWQFNDAWPAISWASFDYFGNWKALQYKAKQLYQNIMVGFTNTRNKAAIKKTTVKVVNDLFQTVRGSAEVHVVDLAGKTIYKNVTLSH